MGKISNETRVQIQEFFESSAGSVILNSLGEMLRECDSLTSGMNEAEHHQNPSVLLAKKAGRAEGISMALDYIQGIVLNEEV